MHLAYVDVSLKRTPNGVPLENWCAVGGHWGFKSGAPLENWGAIGVPLTRAEPELDLHSYAMSSEYAMRLQPQNWNTLFNGLRHAADPLENKLGLLIDADVECWRRDMH